MGGASRGGTCSPQGRSPSSTSLPLTSSSRESELQASKLVGSGQLVILKARPAMDAAVMSFHLSLSPTSSSSLTRFRPVVMPYNDKPALFKSFLYVVHPPLLWASNRSFSRWLSIMIYGWPPLFVHFGDMSISFHSPLPNSVLCYFLPCPSDLLLVFLLFT